MANSLFNQLNQQSPNNISSMMNMIKGSNNPQQALMNLACNNSQVGSILREVQQSGGDAKSLFFRKAQQMGIDPNQILNQLR